LTLGTPYIVEHAGCSMPHLFSSYSIVNIEVLVFCIYMVLFRLTVTLSWDTRSIVLLLSHFKNSFLSNLVKIFA